MTIWPANARLSMSYAAALCALALSHATNLSASGQILHATDPLPSFEVATIRPWQAPPPPPPSEGIITRRVARVDPGSGGGLKSDRVQLIAQTEILLELAYNLPLSSRTRIVGAPDWVETESERYEIQAKIEGSTYAAMQTMTPAQQHEQVSLMEQSLLADRFKLKVHFETREIPGYALVVAKGGPRLTAAGAGETSRISTTDNERGTELTATSVTLDQFVHSPLLRPGGRMVVDQTGLQGTYDFTLRSESQRLAAADSGHESDAPSLFTAIQEQLGLRLVAAKIPVEVIVIDHIEKPSQN